MKISNLERVNRPPESRVEVDKIGFIILICVVFTSGGIKSFGYDFNAVINSYISC